MQIRNNVWFKTPEIPADAPMLTGDSVETSILKDNRAVALATDGKVPKPPRALRAIPRFEAIELRWQPNAAKDVVGYHVYCDGKRITPYAVGGWFWVHTALKTGEKHRYMVVAVNLWDREGARSEAIEAPAP